jgi:anti-sigma-K factor RskA
MSTVQRSHEELEALIAADALGGLSEDERRAMLHEMASHGPECPECGRLVADYGDVAGQIALLAAPVALSQGASERLLDRAGVEDASGRSRTPRARAGRRWIAAVAVAASLVAAGVIGYEVAPRPAGVQVVAFRAGAGRSLAVAYQPGTDHGVLIGSNLTAPPPGKVYELWFLPAGSSQMRPAGTFGARGGDVRMPVALGSSFTALAVSVEPSGGSRHPTTRPVFSTNVG